MQRWHCGRTRCFWPLRRTLCDHRYAVTDFNYWTSQIWNRLLKYYKFSYCYIPTQFDKLSQEILDFLTPSTHPPLLLLLPLTKEVYFYLCWQQFPLSVVTVYKERMIGISVGYMYRTFTRWHAMVMQTRYRHCKAVPKCQQSQVLLIICYSHWNDLTSA